MEKKHFLKRIIVIVILTVFFLPTSATVTPVLARTPLFAPASEFNFKQLNMVDENNGWAWSVVGQLLRTTDGGVNWVDVTPSFFPEDFSLTDSYFDAQSALLYTPGGSFRTSDGGQTWQNVTLGPLPEAASHFRVEMHWVTPNDGWAAWAEGAAGNAYVTVYETHDGGASFTPGNFTFPGELPNTIHLGAICGDSYYFDFDKIIIVDGTLSCGNGGPPSVRVFRNGAQLDNTFNLPAPQSLSNSPSDPEDPVFLSDLVGTMDVKFMDAAYTSSTTVQYLTRDGGYSWTLLGDGQPLFQAQPTPRFFSGNQAFSTWDGKLRFTQDGGLTWKTIASDFDFSPGYGREVVEMQFVNNTTGWFVYKADDKSYLFKTTDGGSHWKGPALPEVTPAFEGQIAYVGTDGNIYLMKGDLIPNQLTYGLERSIRSLQFSMSGRWLSYIDKEARLHILDTSLTGFPEIFSIGNAGAANWANKSDLLAYTVNANIMTFDPSSMLQTDLYSPTTNLAWAPDDKTIASTYNPGGSGNPDANTPGSSIVLVEVSTSNASQIRQEEKGVFIPGEITWSPNSKYLFYAPCHYQSECFLIRQAIDLSGNSAGPFADPWSTDSQWIYATSGVANLPSGATDDEIYRSHPDGSARQRLFYQAGYANLVVSLSPDDKTLLFKSGEAVPGYGGTGQNDPRLKVLDVSTLLTQQVGNEDLYFLDWSPSGNSVLVSDFVYDAQVYLPARLSIYDVRSGTFILKNLEVDTGEAGGGTGTATWGRLPQAEQKSQTLSGRVSQADQTPLEGVAILLDGTQATTTDQSGNFQIAGVSTGKHVIEPRLDGYTFSPPNIATNIEQDVNNLAFLAQKVAQVYLITGDVYLGDQTPLAGVSILLDGKLVTTTDTQGKFRIPGVGAGTHTVEPQFNSYIFSPKNETRNIEKDTNFSFLAQNPADITLKAIEVTQVVQDLNNSVPLIAGKSTLVRVYFQSNGRDVTSFQASLIGKRADGSLIDTSPLAPLNSIGVSSRSMDEIRADTNATLNFRLPPLWLLHGDITLSVQWKSDAFVCEVPGCQVTVNFQYVPQPEMRFFLFSTDGRSPVENAFQEVKNEILTEYPISGFQLNGGDAAKRWMDPADYDTESVYKILLAQRILDDCTIGCQWIYVGIMDDKPTESQIGVSSVLLQGGAVGYWMPDNRQMLPVIPHEIAHAYGRQHAPYCNAENSSIFKDYVPYPDGRISPTLTGNNALYGVRITNPATQIDLFNPINSFDLMTYCFQDANSDGGVWPSDFTYKKLLEEIQKRYADNNQSGIHQAAYQIPENQMSIVASGRVDQQTNTITDVSIYTVPVTPYPVQQNGEYHLQVYDSNGTLSVETAFDPFLSDTGKGFFNLAVPAPQGVARVTISRGDEVLFEKSASNNEIQVSIISPNGGETLSGNIATLTWSATQVDGSAQLRYVVQYSRDAGQSWSTLAVDLTDQQLEIPLDLVPGTSQGILRVFASDGFLTASDMSDNMFTVAGHTPTVKIKFPESGQSFQADQTIILQGETYDPEDGQNSNLIWQTDHQATIGNENFISIPASQLTPGSHTITLTATDADGNTASDSIQVNVEASGSAPAAIVPTPDQNQPASMLQSLQPIIPYCLFGLAGLGMVGLGVSAFLYLRSRKGTAASRKGPSGSMQVKTKPRQVQPIVTHANTTPSPPPVKPKPGENLNKAQQLIKSGSNQEASLLLSEMVKAEPDNATAWLLLGYALANMKNLASAERCFLQAKNLGDGRADQAIAWLKKTG